MSLNKTLNRLFDEIRREARRNPDFADRLDAVVRGHDSRRDVADEVIEDVMASAPEESAPEEAPPKRAGPPKRSAPAEQASAPLVVPPSLNPIGLYQREGEHALVEALKDQALPSLRALVREHNLDPGGETEALDRDALAAHVLAQAKKRAERDSKLFDY